jgi:hypothetical protein
MKNLKNSNKTKKITRRWGAGREKRGVNNKVHQYYFKTLYVNSKLHIDYFTQFSQTTQMVLYI